MEHAPIIDRKTIDMLREMDAITEDDLLLELIDEFLHHAQEVVVAIKNSVEQSDYRQVAAQTHSLKGASLNMGMLELYTICEKLEASARAFVAEADANRNPSSGGLVQTKSRPAVDYQIAALEPTYQRTVKALCALRERISRGEAIDDLLG